MANAEQLDVLKQGADAWNKWRSAYIKTKIEPSKANYWEADLRGADLVGAILKEVDLTRADLSGADLTGANLYKAHLSEVDFRRAKLSDAHLFGSNLYLTDFRGADLRGANLNATNLREADLRGVDLKRASLCDANLYLAILDKASFFYTDFSRADLKEASLRGANLSKAIFGGTNVSFTDLSMIEGLRDVTHFSPSILGRETLINSKGQIPDAFLRGCGFSDWEIESAKLYNPNLSNEEVNQILYKLYDLRAQQPLQISPLFISYSHGDSSFVDKMEESLNEKGIRFWRDIHDATAGRLEKQIDRAISHNPTVLLVLSENSIKSDWVEHEVRTARELEKETGRDVLCPVALDDSWKTSPWPKRVMQQVMEYNILDFSKWKDDAEFGKLFKKLIDGLELFYKG
jgi:uncharacterized protein YjbI with pentapeptide repeats